MSPNAIIKQICKDVYLIKEYLQIPSANGAVEEVFVFRMTNNSLKEIEFAIDFKDS